MWSRFKALPLFPKVLIIVLVLTVLYKAGGDSYQRTASGFTREAAGDSEAFGRPSDAPARDDSGSRQALTRFQSEQAQLQARVAQCESEMTEATNRQAAAAMNGVLFRQPPPCEAQMPAYIAREAYLETEIYRLKTGDRTSSMQQITGVQVGARDDRRSSAPSRSGDGTEAVEDWDRSAIRGTSIYADEDGRQHELPTRDYYYRDRSSGSLIGSDQPTPPNDGRDYEQFQPASRPQ